MKLTASQVVFIALLLVGSYLRLAGLTWGIPFYDNSSSVYHDEGHVLGFVVNSWESFAVEFGEYEIARPVLLYRLVGRPLIALGNILEVNDGATRVYELAALRTISAAIGIGGLIAMYFLGKMVGGKSIGLWAMALLTFMPGHWYYSQVLKGDIIVSLVFTLILIFSIRIARTGSRWAYVWAGLALGAGVALKVTCVIAAPVLLLAHVYFAWSKRDWKKAVSMNFGWLVLAGAVSFSALYPYPYLNWHRYMQFVKYGGMQDFNLKILVMPQEYASAIWAYTSPGRPFFEMIYGKFLLWAIVPCALYAAFIAVKKFKEHREPDLLIIFILLAFFVHSLTFTPPLDDRYVLPAASFVVLFPALLVKYKLGIALNAGLLAGTFLITAMLFPMFAWDDARRDVVYWIEENASAGGTIAQPSQLDRWALRFNREKYEGHGFVVEEGDARHVNQSLKTDYVVIQREGWNYDHSFRYELTGLEDETAQFLSHYNHVKQFGQVPYLFGMRLPQNIGVPVIDVYARK